MSDYEPGSCKECGDPWEDHQPDHDVAVEVRKRAEFDQAVAARVEELVAERKYFEALIAWKMARAHGDKSVPRPRSAAADRDEILLIEAREHEADFRGRVDQRVQAAKLARGDAEFIRDPNTPTREQWLRGVGKSADWETKDA